MLVNEVRELRDSYARQVRDAAAVDLPVAHLVAKFEYYCSMLAAIELAESQTENLAEMIQRHGVIGR